MSRQTALKRALRACVTEKLRDMSPRDKAAESIAVAVQVGWVGCREKRGFITSSARLLAIDEDDAS